jgi:hypothetical protein
MAGAASGGWDGSALAAVGLCGSSSSDFDVNKYY